MIMRRPIFYKVFKPPQYMILRITIETAVFIIQISAVAFQTNLIKLLRLCHFLATLANSCENDHVVNMRLHI